MINEFHPNYIHYSLGWKVTVNNRQIMSKDVEQDIKYFWYLLTTGNTFLSLS